MTDVSVDAPSHPIRGRGLFAVPGYRGAAVASGVKTSGALDLAVIVADEPSTVAGVFTTNECAAAPILQARASLTQSPRVRSIVINSGNANALTGPQGLADADAMRDRLADRTGGPSLVLSTGVIGVPLPMERVLAGIDATTAALRFDDGGVDDVGSVEHDVAEAMRTTDSHRKVAAVRVGDATVGGVAKGSGMIHPRMATMLAVVATDARVAADDLDAMLRHAVDQSFNRISVDGDTSTNDAVLLLARPPEGRAGDAEGAAGPDVHADDLAQGIDAVCRSLAEQIVTDGEGVGRTMEITVSGARSADDAHRIAESIGRSTLVKTALTGGDPNWGRILAAAGNAGAGLDPSQCTLRLGDDVLYELGDVRAGDDAARGAAFSQDRVRIALAVGTGPGTCRLITTDLTTRYVELNSEYTT